MPSGGSLTYRRPDPGYHVLDVLVDGSSVGPRTYYEFTNVTASHTIAASFAADNAGPSGSGSVAVSAQAPAPVPALSFAIAPGTAPDGGTVTASWIDFATLSHEVPNTGTQRLTVSTNAQGGYSVTSAEDHALRNGTYAIADVLGDSGVITEMLPGAWALSSTHGFGYGLSNASGSDAAFTSGFKQFADASASEAAQQVMTATGPRTGSAVDVTYKVNIGPDQAQGTYTNTLTYVCTGNFKKGESQVRFRIVALATCVALVALLALPATTVADSAGVGVSANVGAALTFSVAAGSAPSGGSVTVSAIDFGSMVPGTPKTGSHRLTVSANAANGYSVTAEEDRPLLRGRTRFPTSSAIRARSPKPQPVRGRMTRPTAGATRSPT